MTQKPISLILVFLCLLAVLTLASCSTPSPTATAALTRVSTRTLTPTPSPTVTITPTSTASPTATQTSSPTATPDLHPMLLTTLGKGLMGNVVYSPNGKMIAMTEGETLHWLDAASGVEIGSLDLGDDMLAVDKFSPDSLWILVRLSMGARVVNTMTGSVDNCCGFIRGEATFSTDSRYLVSRSDGSTSGGPYDSVIVFGLETRQRIETDTDRLRATQIAANDNPYWEWNQSYPVLSPNNYHTMSAPAISPDNRWLAAGYQDTHHNLLYVWDLQTGIVQFSISHIAGINSVAFSPDGLYLASGGNDGVLRLFAVSTGKLDRAIAGFMDSITDIRFSADGRQIIVSVSDQPDQVYGLATNQVEPLVTPVVTPDPYTVAMHQEGYADGSGVLFSPDGKTLAMGGESVQLWDLAAQKVKLSIEDINQSWTVGWAFSPDGSLLGQNYDQGDIVVRDTHTGAIVLNLTSDMLEAGQGYSAAGGGIDFSTGAGVFTGQGIAFSPDGQRLAFRNGNTIEIWDIASASQIVTMTQPVAPAYATRVSFSADGKRLYAVTGHVTQVWDTQSGQLLDQIDLPAANPGSYNVTTLNGPYFARNNCNEYSYWIELWNLDTGEMLKLPTISQRTEPIRFSPDGSLLIAVSGDNLYFWKTATGKLIYAWQGFSPWQITISSDNITLAVGRDGKAELWDISAIRDAASQESLPPAALPPSATPWGGVSPTETPIPTQSITLPVTSTLPEGAISPENADQLHEAARFGGGVLSDIIWADAPGDITFLTSGSQGVSTFGGAPFSESAHLPTAAWSETVAQLPNGEILAAGVIGQSVQVWNLSTGQLLAEMPGFGPVRLNREGSLLVYGDADGNLRVYDLAAGQSVATLLSAYQSQMPVFSPDNRLLAAVNGYGPNLWVSQFVRIWDIQTGKIVNAVGGPDAAITDLSFSADGKFVVGAAGGSAWIWDVRPEVTRPYQLSLYTGEPDGNLLLYHRRVTAAALNPDDRLLAVGDSERNIWLYEAAGSKLIYRMEGHAAPIDRLRFSPDGTRLLSVDADGTIILWNMASGKAIRSLPTHTGPIRGLVFGLDGNLHAWEANTAWVLHPPDGTLLQTTSIFSGTIFAASPAGDWLAVANRLRMSVWDARTGEFGQTLAGIAGDPFVEYMWEGIILPGFYSAFFSPDGKQLTTKAPGEIWTYILNAESQFQLSDYLPGPSYWALDDQAEHSAASPDGLFSAQTSQRWNPPPTLILFDQNSHEINQYSFSEDTWLTALAFSPDDRLIAVGQADGSISLVDVAAWKLIATLPGHRGAVTSLAFSPDGLTLVSAGEDGTIRFWSAK